MTHKQLLVRQKIAAELKEFNRLDFPTVKGLKMLRERREHLETQIEQMQDAIYIIDCELVQGGVGG